MRFFLVVSVICITLSSYAQAGQLKLGAGTFDVLDNENPRVFEAGYIFDSSILNFDLISLKPMVGGFVTNKSQYYIHSSAVWDKNIISGLYFNASFGPGIYRQGKGKKLGLWLEFRTSLGLEWQFDNGYRIGTEFYHISNANIGSRNPGAEILLFTVSIPTF